MAEPDSYHTPRIAGVITGPREKPVFIIGIKVHHATARANQITPQPRTLVGISTYKGSLDTPVATDPASSLPQIEFLGKSSDELAHNLFDISAALHKGNDIRVCSIGGIRSDDLNWHISIINTRQSE